MKRSPAAVALLLSFAITAAVLALILVGQVFLRPPGYPLASPAEPRPGRVLVPPGMEEPAAVSPPRASIDFLAAAFFRAEWQPNRGGGHGPGSGYGHSRLRELTKLIESYCGKYRTHEERARCVKKVLHKFHENGGCELGCWPGPSPLSGPKKSPPPQASALANRQPGRPDDHHRPHHRCPRDRPTPAGNGDDQGRAHSR